MIRTLLGRGCRCWCVCCCRDESGTISYDEFKNVFNANIGPDAIPFDFDW